MRATAIALLMIFAVRVAAADAVDDAVKDLHGSANQKDRVVAGALLSQASDDSRAIAALADALLHDANKTVRGVAAVGLGKVVTAASTASDQQLAIGALKKASKQDKDPKVRKRAKKSYDNLVRVTAPTTYVEIGSMSGGKNARLGKHMGKTVEKLVQQQPGMQSSAPGNGFHLEATVARLTKPKKVRGGSAKLSCKVQVLLADYPAKQILSSFTGSATVTVGAGAAPAAGTDCVDAVLENLLTKKAFPQIAKLAAKAAAAQSSSTTSTTTSGTSSGSSTTPHP